MRRAAFLALGGVALLPRVLRAQSDADPASTSRRPALRVLLGSGEAAPLSGDLFSFRGRSYRGTFQRLDDDRIVNVVDLEAYLYSVVPREMPPRWPAAALQAQAICARTYVLQRSDPRRSYDLVPSELDQVYDGIAGETPAATAAVDATASHVLTFGGAFARVAYSSCCGGHTEAVSEAWGGAALAYLQGVVCTSCAASPNYRWVKSIALEAIATRLPVASAPPGRLHDVRVIARDASGRARAFELIGDRASATLDGSAFRRAVGSRVLPSLLITNVQRTADGPLQFEGGGMGHGVGLCQWGARGMALQGSQPNDILSFYFAGTVVDLEN
jgi:stage II sporulation protein D